MDTALDDLDATGLLARSEAQVHARRAAEVEGLRIALAWADLHADDPRDAAVPPAPGGDRLVTLGGEGTPRVRQLALPELAVSRQVHTASVRAQLADALDLRHRLPRTLAQVESLRAELWLGAKVASMSRELTPDQVATVDAAVARVIGSRAPAQVITIAEAAIIAADRAGHAERLEDERRKRYVGLSRTDAHGLRMVIARIEAGDALWIDAMVTRVADLLAARPDLRPGVSDDAPRDELRSLAFGWLGRPAELLTLLLESAAAVDEDPDGPDAEGADDAGERPAPSRATHLPTEALALLRTLDLTRLRPRAVLYVHLHEAALTGAGVARVEGVGPVLVDRLRDLLGTTNVVVRPVIDLRHQLSTLAYEFPDWLRERIHLRSPGEVFPHATRTSRRVDMDHPDPFRTTGPPGQTGEHNGGPLSRTHHRAKTHLGYSVTQLGPETYLWRTPHGLHRLVDPSGTHVLADTCGFTPDPRHPGVWVAPAGRFVAA